MTPLCAACCYGIAETVFVALLDGGANINFAAPARRGFMYPGLTPLMLAAIFNHASLAKLLLKRGADGTMMATQTFDGHDVVDTALDLARDCTECKPDFEETFAVLRTRCCSTCGLTSPGLCAATAGEEKHLKRCGDCPARGSRARYCSEQCQRADWVSRHRGEYAEARRARQAAGTEV